MPRYTGGMATRPSRTSDDEDLRRVLNGFRTLVQALRIADRAGVREYGLGSAQIFVLHQLREREPLSINDLAELTSTDQSSVSVVVNKLVQRGYISSTRSEEDARRVELTLTAKGRRTLRTLPAPFQNVFLDSLREIGPARVRSFAKTLEEIVKKIGTRDEAPPMFFED